MTIFNVPVVKAKTTVAIDGEKLPDAMYAHAVAEGLKVMINGGMTKVTKEAYAKPEDYAAKAMEIATSRVEAMMEGKLKLGRAGSSASKDGPSAATLTEARRLARIMVKSIIKEKGGNISHYTSSQITVAANAMIEGDPTIIAQAEANLADRGAVKTSVDIGSLIQPDAKLVAAAEAKKVKAKADAPLSAKQAGKVAPRATAPHVPAH